MGDKLRVLTTGEAAKYCGVHFRTVTRWIRSGHLKAFQLPGRGDSRIFVSDFVAFLRTHNIEVPDELRVAGDKRKALIVEDDPSIAKSIQRILEPMQMECMIATDGFRAGALLSEHKPGLITLDIKMPGLGGLSVLEIIRSLEYLRDSVVLVISGMPEGTLKKAMELGADDFLKKPFSKKALEEKVRKLLITPQARA